MCRLLPEEKSYIFEGCSVIILVFLIKKNSENLLYINVYKYPTSL